MTLEETYSKAIETMFTLAFIIWIIRIVALIALVALITWVVKKVWHAGENRAYKRQQKAWNKAQKKWRKKQNRKEWDTFRKKGIPQNPDFSVAKSNDKFANNPDWKWDEESQLWRHRSQWDKK